MEERVQVYEMGGYGMGVSEGRDNDLGMDLKERTEVFARGEKTRTVEVIGVGRGG